MPNSVTGANEPEHNLTFQVSHCRRIRGYLTKKNIYSVICCLIFFLLGWLYKLSGPPLLELQLTTGVTFTMASSYITCFNVAHMIGSLMIGFVVYKRVNAFFLFIICLSVAALSTEVIPFCYNYIQMIISQGSLGISTGGLDILVIAEMSALWGSSSETPMHALYFSLGLGSVLSPICMTPFLKNLENTDVFSGKENSSFPTSTNELPNINSSIAQLGFIKTGRSVEQLSPNASSRLYIPYSISAGLAGILLFATLVIFIKKITGRFNVIYSHDNTTAGKKRVSGISLYVTLVITGLMSALDTAMEDSFADFVPTFCVTQMGWSSQGSAYVVLVAAIAIVVGRLVGLLLQASSLSTIKLMTYYALLLIVAHVGSVLSGIYSLDFGIWISSFLSGFGVAVLSPCIFTLTEEYFFPVSGKIAAYFIIVASLGSGLNSLLIGYLMEHVNNMQLPYVLLIESVVYVILISICVKLIRLKPGTDTNMKDLPSNISRL